MYTYVLVTPPRIEVGPHAHPRALAGALFADWAHPLVRAHPAGRAALRRDRINRLLTRLFWHGTLLLFHWITGWFRENWHARAFLFSMASLPLACEGGDDHWYYPDAVAVHF